MGAAAVEERVVPEQSEVAVDILLPACRRELAVGALSIVVDTFVPVGVFVFVLCICVVEFLVGGGGDCGDGGDGGDGGGGVCVCVCVGVGER